MKTIAVLKNLVFSALILVLIIPLSSWAEIKADLPAEQEQLVFEHSEEGLKELLDHAEKIIEKNAVALGLAYWNLYSDEAEADLDTAEMKQIEFFNNKAPSEIIEVWYKDLNTIQDPTLRRRIQLWHNILTSAKVDMDPEIFDLKNQLEGWMVDGEKAEDRPAPEQMENMVFRLMNLRNKKAKSLGFANYAEMVLEMNDIDPEWFSAMIEAIDKATKKHYQKLLDDFKKKENKEEIGYLDVKRLISYSYKSRMMPYRKEMEQRIPLMKETLSNIGIDYDSLPLRFLVKDIPYGGNAIAVRIPDDMRIVIMPDIPFPTWMHELGHGLHGVFNAADSPVIKGYEWYLGNSCCAFAEGMAETAVGLSKNPEWQKKYGGLSEEEIEEKNRRTRTYLPAVLRYEIANIQIEIEMYRDLTRDPQDVRDTLYRKYLYLDRPYEEPLDITKNIVFVSYPVYLQNYLIAEIISWQIHEALEKKFGKNYVFNTDVGPYLIKTLFETGELYPWQQRMKMATEKELDVHGWLRSCGLLTPSPAESE